MDDKKPKPLTVGELRHELSAWPDDAEITFGSTVDGHELVFMRFKTRGDKLLHIDVGEYMP
ncbi:MULTISPECIES: hypothetical protein [Xanthomonas]|uniref:Pilin assembly protein n=2 Tax=Xanthomonas citri TaxID=346 RepID=A0AB33CCG1_XANCI|nr:MULTISPECIES: hypothetical protein [Xanthomonas]MBV6780929.1 hypothetical protein [Xanthomonas campestris pv. trichodesmae]ASK91847.1 hypothetical protein XcvCFBP7111P_10310 [Xanthomonas citri pv. vignicola]MBV6788453.1 hypothetical protein [Xanthomonas campestris pv. clerodendri]MBZ3919232.1 hypothetical protein [Xanthomonas campestris pv. trichodesmae]MBZ3922887.1 hypothetical protein [Xanthomonas citri pv. sesbaniae]